MIVQPYVCLDISFCIKLENMTDFTFKDACSLLSTVKYYTLNNCPTARNIKELCFHEKETKVKLIYGLNFHLNLN